MAMKENWLTHGRMLWYVYGNVGKEKATEMVSKGVNLMGL